MAVSKVGNVHFGGAGHPHSERPPDGAEVALFGFIKDFQLRFDLKCLSGPFAPLLDFERDRKVGKFKWNGKVHGGLLLWSYPFGRLG